MAYKGDWSREDQQRLKKLWVKSGKNRDRFRELVMADKKFKKKGLGACQQKAIRMHLFEQTLLSGRFVFSNLEKTQSEELKKTLADDNIGWEETKQKFPGFTEKQFQNFANRCGIKINKEKPGRKAAKVPEAGVAGVVKEEEELTSEQKLIKRREARDITPEGFIAGLAELKPVSDLAIYWRIIENQLKEKRIIRNTDLLPFAVQLQAPGAKELFGKKRTRTNKNLRERVLSYLRGVLGKFVEWSTLSRFTIGRPGLEAHEEYICNLPRFYTPEELKRFIPDSEKPRVLSGLVGAYESDNLVGLIPENEMDLILDLLPKDSKDPPKPLKKLADELRSAVGEDLLSEVLESYVSRGLVQETKQGFRVSALGAELGLDAQSTRTLDATALENEVFAKKEEGGGKPGSLKEVGGLIRRDMASKTVPVIDLTAETKGKDFKLLAIGEVMYGSQYTDQELLDWVLDAVTEPTFVTTSGLVQGTFEVRNKNKSRMLVEGLDRAGIQIDTAGLLLETMERLATSHVCVIQGDDDWRLAEDYATQMHLLEGKNPWKFGVDWRSFSAEMKRRLENRELRRKFRIQWEAIQSYMYRVGRQVYNKKEVEAKIGVSKSEYRLIIEIMVAKRNNFDYPKEYEQVVNVDALYGNIGKRIVSPDPLRIKVADDKEIRLVHNAGFSDITMYAEPIQHLDAIARHMGLSRHTELPWMIADFHQEAFCLEFLMGTWIMNLPGMQNTLAAATSTMTEYSTKILESKERRQSRVRKEPPSPAAVEIVYCQDGRVRIRVLNNTIRQILKEQKGEKEKIVRAVIGTDWQFGSITEWPELVAKFLDYGLYDQRASRLYINGDFTHGNIYPQYNAENRPTRLTTLHAQQNFSFNLLVPLILDAPALTDLAAWLGNHEWNNLGAKYAGDSPLTFLETGLRGVIMERKRVGTESPLERAMTVSRIRWRDTHNPQGDIVNWPFFADTICGFKVAIQHMWQPLGGSNPTNDAKNWLKRMAKASKGIDLLIGGHKHCVWMAQLADKLIVQAGSGAGQSGYELQRGLMSTVMFTLIEFSNHEGITVEFVPWEFLRDYKFQCPAYRGKDEQFVRSLPGTREYKQGKMSPIIELMIDDLTAYLEV